MYKYDYDMYDQPDTLGSGVRYRLLPVLFTKLLPLLYLYREICIQFLLPLPRDEGYETMFLEFAGHQFQMTSLLNYKVGVDCANMPRETLPYTYYGIFLVSLWK